MTGVEVKGTHDPTPWEGHMAGWDQKESFMFNSYCSLGKSKCELSAELML